MLKKLTSLILALLIGNPMCCCAMTNLIVAENQETAPFHSCCDAAKQSQSQDQAPEEPDSCLCPLGKEEFTLNTQSTFLKAVKNDVKSEDFSDIVSSLVIPNLPLAAGYVSNWPLGFLPIVPPLKERLALRSTYLL